MSSKNRRLFLTRTRNPERPSIALANFDDDTPPLFTLEPPWRNNEQNRSCIPDGTYTCRWHRSPKHGMCYHVLSVPGRDRILIHKGNTVKDTTGCILIGCRLTNETILDSKEALAELHEEMGDEFTLVVVSEPPARI